jgi:hypothetical protein
MLCLKVRPDIAVTGVKKVVQRVAAWKRSKGWVDIAVRNFWANFNERQSHSQPADSEHSRRAHRRILLNLLFKTMAAVSQISKKRKVWPTDSVWFMDDGWYLDDIDTSRHASIVQWTMILISDICPYFSNSQLQPIAFTLALDTFLSTPIQHCIPIYLTTQFTQLYYSS